MAKAKLNPILTSMRGRIGNVVFYRRQGREYVRLHVIPRNPDTEAQRIVRRTFADAVRSWQSMTREERYKFNRRAYNLCRSGYNLYISEYMKTRVSVKTGLKPVSIKNGLYSSCIQKPITPVSSPFVPASRGNTSCMAIQFRPG